MVQDTIGNDYLAIIVLEEKKIGYLYFIKIIEIWTKYVKAFCALSDVFEFLKKNI